MKTGNWYVIKLGGRYIRCVDPPVVCCNLEHAHRFTTLRFLERATQKLLTLKTSEKKLTRFEVVFKPVM